MEKPLPEAWSVTWTEIKVGKHPEALPGKAAIVYPSPVP